MNLNVDLGTVQWKRLRPSRPVFIALIGAAALALAGAWAWYHVNHPPRPWLVRWRLNRYLASEAHQSNFKVAAFTFPSKAEMAKSSARDEGPEPKGTRTGKTFDALREEYLDLAIAVAGIENQLSSSNNSARAAELVTRRQALEPMVDDLWELQRKLNGGLSNGDLARACRQLMSENDQKLAEADSYPMMYPPLGQELWVAGRLLDSKNPDHRRAAVTLALGAARQALDYVENGSVAARICEGYVLPNLDLATDANPRSPFNPDNLLRQCADLFLKNNEFPNAARVYAGYLEHATTAQRKDWARTQIADAYERGGDLKTALAYLKQVSNTNDNRVSRRITWLQRRVGK